MTKYIIEGNLNFYDELYKSLDDDDTTNNDINVCQITGLPLVDKSVMLECNHKFNYDALYKEICRQKFVFKTYDAQQLSNPNLKKFINSKLDYFIKCPYCRDIQFTILPYYEELELEQKYGVNSLNKQHSYIPIHNVSQHYANGSCCVVYGIMFEKNGPPCNKLLCEGTKCNNKYTAFLPETQISYCFTHYKFGLREFKLAEKKKKQDEKKQMLKDANIERESKGLPPLKRLVKKKIENVVETINAVNVYVPEDAESVQTISGCSAILKTGLKKGSMCGCKKINADGLCKRHSLNEVKDSNEVNKL